MERQRRVKMGQTEVYHEVVSLLHEDDLLGRYYSRVRVGSDEWFAWLDTAKSFSFTVGKGSFVARKELRAGNTIYWYAYRKIDGKTVKRYIGKTETLTYDRLREVAKSFYQKEGLS